MSVRKLGRGLDALISQPQPPAPAAEPEAAAPKEAVLQLDPKRIVANPEQPRKRFSLNELEDLKASISREGILQPLLVRRRDGEFELVAGERRLRAARELGLAAVPALAIDVGDDRMLELALIENIHREDLNPIELAQAFRQLLELKGWTQDALAQNLGLSRPLVGNTIRVLDLPEDIQNAIARRQITMGHAKVLLSIGDPKEQRMLFEKIAEEKLSVRDLEEARPEPAPEERRKRRGRRKVGDRSAQAASLEEELSQALGARVVIRQGKGKGSVTIEFYSNDDFERIRKLLLAAR